MKTTLSNFIIFAAGAAIGSAVTWKIVKTKYEQIAREEIASVKERFCKREHELVEDLEQTQEILTDIREYSKTLKDNNYVNYSGITDSKNEEEDEMEPYVIDPKVAGEDDHDIISLTYYEGDGVLTDDQDVPVEDVDGTVGYDSLTHFGDYEDDSVFVRNDRLKADYEILLDIRAYSDVIKNNPHLAEDE